MDKWLETKQIPVHCVSAAGVVYKENKAFEDACHYCGHPHFGTFRKSDKSVEYVNDHEL